MNKKVGQIIKDLDYLVQLDRKIKKLPELSQLESELIETEQRFESTYYSNKLEGNKLSKQEARKAIMPD